MSERDAGGQFVRARAESVAIGVAAQPDHVFRADVRGQQRRADDGPGETAARQKELVAAARLFGPQGKPEPHRNVHDQRPAAENPVESRK